MLTGWSTFILSPTSQERTFSLFFQNWKLNLLQRLGSFLLGYLFQQLSKLIIWGLCHTLAAIWTSRRARRLLWCYWLMLLSACACTNSTPAAARRRHATCAPPRISFLDLQRSPLFKKSLQLEPSGPRADWERAVWVIGQLPDRGAWYRELSAESKQHGLIYCLFTPCYLILMVKTSRQSVVSESSVWVCSTYCFPIHKESVGAHSNRETMQCNLLYNHCFPTQN